ncbi:MAG: hypothetical protein CMQ61_05520 [Gammaproteobacteria bacterium]|nr:hypothetical protein [Gammaproteobacteria bacterium]|tara:strand:- start:1519 stop:1716 length:198 start_codon:yes stop_codon:yes gene_type:complete
MGGRYALEDLELQVLILHNKRRGRSVMELTEEEPGAIAAEVAKVEALEDLEERLYGLRREMELMH